MSEISIDIDAEHKTALVVVKGSTSLSECLVLAGTLTDHPEYRPSFRVLGDVRELSFAPSYDEAADISSFFMLKRDLYGNGLGILVGSRLQYGLTRMINQLLGGQNDFMVPFLGESDAMAWLGRASSV